MPTGNVHPRKLYLCLRVSESISKKISSKQYDLFSSKQWFLVHYFPWIKLIHTIDLFLYHRKTSHTALITYHLLYSTYYIPLFSFYTPWNHQKTFGFFDVFKGCKKRLVVRNKCLDTDKIFQMEEKTGWSNIFIKTTYVIIWKPLKWFTLQIIWLGSVLCY